MAWFIYRAEDALKLEQRLQSHLEALHRYLTAINTQVQVQSVEKADKKLENVTRTIDEVHTRQGLSRNPAQDARISLGRGYSITRQI